MKWYEVIEDLGDGSNAVRRFRTKEEATNYADRHEEYCYSGVSEEDTEGAWLFFEEIDDI